MQSNLQLTQPSPAALGRAAGGTPWLQPPASLLGSEAARAAAESFTGGLAVLFAAAVLLLGMLALYYFEQGTDQRLSHWQLFEAKSEDLATSSSSLPPRAPPEKPGAPDSSDSSENSPGGGGAAAPATQEGPPPICPRLILASTTARFQVATSSLANPGGVLELKGATGRALLRAAVDARDGHVRSLALSSVNEEEPLCTVRMQGAAEGAMDILCRYQQKYGVMEIHSLGHATVRYRGEAIMDIRFSEAEFGRRPNSKMMIATSMDGRQLGTGVPEHDNWKLSVAPGGDAVLICSCMLALVLQVARGATAQEGPGPAGWPAQGQVGS